MYTNYFGFRDIPFRQLSDPRHVYMSTEFETARSELLEALGEDARLVLLTGHAGTGKTKLLRHLHVYLEQSRPIFYLPFSPLHIEMFIDQAACELDLEIEDDLELFDSFRSALAQRVSTGIRPILLIDDAHNLGCDVLEHLIDLFQLSPGQEPLAQLVLAANPEIDYTLQRPELAELEQNLARLSRLQPLPPTDVEPYITFALRAIGYEGDEVFTADAVRQIASQTRGVPELINRLCEASFTLAEHENCKPVTAEIVEAAVEEVAGFSVSESEPVERIGQDLEWIVDDTDTVESARMPGLIQAWMKRSRRWPIAAVGVGGTVALTAVLVLVGTMPFNDNAANARIQSENTVLQEQLETLRAEVLLANRQRDNLKTQLDYQMDERDRLADKLAQVQGRELQASLDQMEAEPQTNEASDVEAVQESAEDNLHSTAEKLLADLMRNAESEAETIALKISGELGGAPSTLTHTVQAGDTLWNISRRYDMNVETLMSLNDIAPGDKIVIGRTLQLAKPGTEVASIESEASIPAWYTVKAGDSLYGIGRQFDSTVDDLKRWNQLANGNQLLVGQRLRVAAN